MTDNEPSEYQPESNIYTVLTIVATLFLAAGTVYVGFRAQALYGSWLPF